MCNVVRNSLKRPNTTEPLPRPEKGDETWSAIIGLFASLTPDQQKVALDYAGPENHWNAEFRSDKNGQPKPLVRPRHQG